MPHISREVWTGRLCSGSVLNAQGQPVLITQPYTPHTRLFYYRHIEDEPELPDTASIVFEDDHLLVADKLHFMPVTPAGRYVQQSLLVQLKNLTGCDDLVPYQLEPVSGKRHQLRVHMLALGLPLEGDLFYPEVLRRPDEPEDFS